MTSLNNWSLNMSVEISKFVANNEVTPSSLRENIEYLLSETDLDGKLKPMMAPMIWGPPGIGKTESVRQIAESWGCRLVAIHLPQYDPTDLNVH